MKVYEVSVTGRFLLMADDEQDAVFRARGLCGDLQSDFPGREKLSLGVYEIRRQDAYMRSQCINAEFADTSSPRQEPDNGS